MHPTTHTEDRNRPKVLERQSNFIEALIPSHSSLCSLRALLTWRAVGAFPCGRPQRPNPGAGKQRPYT